MKRSSIITLCVFASTACTVEEGNFDGSFGFDGDFGWKDADQDDAGSDDAGSDGSDMRDGGAADSGMLLGPADVTAVFARGRCKALRACMGDELLRAAYEGNDCVDYITRQLADRHLHWLPQSITAGRVIFRSSSLEECERDVAALGCEVVNRPLPPSCEQAVEGQLELDEDCTIDQDCAGTAFCDKGALETCPGQCAALQSSGLPCQSSSQCSAGLVCEDGICTAPLAEGDECASRMGAGACPPGLVCQGQSGELSCQSVETVYIKKLDEPCDALNLLCEFELVCESTGTGTAGICRPSSALNASCKAAEPSQCQPSQYCKASDPNSIERVAPGRRGVCSNRPAAGESCSHTSCTPGTRCLGSPAECQTLKVAGQQCESSGECYGGLCEADVCTVTTIRCS